MRNKLSVGSIICLALFIMCSCSNQKNTKKSRLYHEINTRYNIYYNADIAYDEALKSKEDSYVENLSRMLSVYPVYPEDQKKIAGFDKAIDKCVKAIKLHSIQAKPERDPSKRNNLEYQEWLQQKEFNPFLKNVWMLMAKSEYQSLDYVKSISTFSYITRLFKNDEDVITEANLWMAMAYTQMGWVYEADNLFHKIELNGGVPDKHKDLFSEVYANYLVKNKEYEKSVPYLQQAVKGTGGKQNIRLKYLLAQVYAKIGDRAAAYKAYDDVQGLSTPYSFSLNAQLQQAAFIDPLKKDETKKTLSSLKGMSGKLKNAEYLDQIYYAIGNIYIATGDTANSIKNYHLAIEKTTRNGYDVAIAQVALGDIYFTQKEYVKAQPLYPSALGVLGKSYERYAELTLRSEVLDELAVHAEAIHLQDSLQVLAKMTEAERLAAIDNLIELEKKKDKDEKKKQEQENWKANNAEERPDMVGKIPMGSTDNTFYFYNNISIAQGKTAFKKQWGNRKLEDNWRRKDKGTNVFGDFNAETAIVADSSNTEQISVIDSTNTNAGGRRSVPDRFTRQFYLDQIPLTPHQLRESNAIVEEAYYQMGLVYKNKLGDLDLAIEAFNMALIRFPSTTNKEEIYYQLFLIYSQRNDRAMLEMYRNKLIAEFPEGAYAITLSDPNYEWNLRNMSRLENDLYDETYQAYLDGKVNVVRTNYTVAKDKYPLTVLMPKFMFVNALTYAQTNDSKNFTAKLKELVEKYPAADVVPLANEMLKGILSGKSLVAGGPMRGMIWDVPFTGQDYGNIDTTLTFVDNPKTDYQVMLIFDPAKVNRNDLIYNVADYNFSTFILKAFDLIFTEMKPFEILQIQGLDSFADVADYTHKAFGDSSLVKKIDPSIVLVPISNENYRTLTRGLSLNQYFAFFEKTYGKQLPELVAYWNKQIHQATEEKEKTDAEQKESGARQEVKPEIKPEDKSKEESKIVRPDDKPQDKTAIEKKAEEVKKTVDEGVETIITDETINKVGKGINDANDAFNEIMNNPVDGIKNLLNKNKNKPKLTKEEKQQLKEEKNKQKALDKEQRKREKAVSDSIKADQKGKEDAIERAEREKIDMEEAVVKAKEDARKDAIKAKETARKEREQERNDKEREQKARLKLREKERNDRLKQREQEQKEKQKSLEQERKNKAKQRELELKEKERQRQNELGAKERSAKEKVK